MKNEHSAWFANIQAEPIKVFKQVQPPLFPLLLSRQLHPLPNPPSHTHTFTHSTSRASLSQWKLLALKRVGWSLSAVSVSSNSFLYQCCQWRPSTTVSARVTSSPLPQACSNCLSKEKWPLLACHSPLARRTGDFGLSQLFTNTAKYNAKAAACAVQTFTGTARGRWVEPVSRMPGNSDQTSLENREAQEPNNAATLFLNVRGP